MDRRTKLIGSVENDPTTLVRQHLVHRTLISPIRRGGARVSPKMDTNHARGWRRIGIVVSVIWFIAFGCYVWTDSTRSNGEFYSFQLRMCSAALDIRNQSLQYARTPEERDQGSSHNEAEYEKCETDAKTLFFSGTDQLYRGIPLLLGVDLAIIAVGWALVWFVVFVVRWVRRGFASA